MSDNMIQGVSLHELLGQLQKQLAVAENTAPAATVAVAVKPNKAKGNGKPASTYQTMVLWVHKAIKYYRSLDADDSGKPKYKGINTLYTGFYRALADQFGVSKEEVWRLLDKMAESGDIGKHGVKGKNGNRGSSMIYLPGEMSSVRRPLNTTSDREAIAKM